MSISRRIDGKKSINFLCLRGRDKKIRNLLTTYLSRALHEGGCGKRCLPSSYRGRSESNMKNKWAKTDNWLILLGLIILFFTNLLFLMEKKTERFCTINGVKKSRNWCRWFWNYNPQYWVSWEWKKPQYKRVWAAKAIPAHITYNKWLRGQKKKREGKKINGDAPRNSGVPTWHGGIPKHSTWHCDLPLRNKTLLVICAEI